VSLQQRITEATDELERVTTTGNPLSDEGESHRRRLLGWLIDLRREEREQWPGEPERPRAARGAI
jgi:hypothetical protein